jgi:hypothetical protein
LNGVGDSILGGVGDDVLRGVRYCVLRGVGDSVHGSIRAPRSCIRSHPAAIRDDVGIVDAQHASAINAPGQSRQHHDDHGNGLSRPPQG